MNLSPEALKEFEETSVTKSPLKRMGKPEEVARLARFLLSEDSSFIVGAEIVIDGGFRWA